MTKPAQETPIVERLATGLIPLRLSFALSLILIGCEILQGTQVAFAVLVFLYIQAFVVAFNSTGGMMTMNGMALAAMALKTVIISQVAKVIMNEPAHLHLDSPTLTMQVMFAGMFTVASVALLGRFVRGDISKQFEATANPTQLRKIAISSLVLGLVGCLVYFGEGAAITSGALRGMMSYLRFGLSLSSVAAVAARVIETRKEKSLDSIVIITILAQVFIGLITTSKQVSFEGFLSWPITAFFFGYRLKKQDWVAAGGALFFLVVFIAPFSYMARTRLATDTLGNRAEIVPQMVLDSLLKFDSSFALYNERKAEERAFLTEENSYYSSTSLLLERFSLIKAADTLINTTQLKGALGTEFFVKSLDILPNSLTGFTTFRSGVFLGQWTGLTSEEDDVTSVAFTPFAEAFVVDKMLGVIILTGVFFFLFLFANQMCFPSLRGNIWAVWLLMLTQHSITESSPAWIVFHLTRVIPFCWGLRLLFLWISKVRAPRRRLEQSPV